MSKISKEQKVEFLKKHPDIVNKAFVPDYTEDKAIKKELAELAREELGYAQNTVDVDICLTLFKHWKEM